MGQVELEQLSEHVFRISVPTRTIPPLNQTNTYVIKAGQSAYVVDCGGAEMDVIAQVASLFASLGIKQVIGYVATHYHPDHTVGIPLLRQLFEAPVYVHPFDQANAAKEMHMDSAHLQAPAPVLTIASVSLRVMHQPGHTHGHLHIQVDPDDLLMVGDHMAGEGTVWIGPPDGHMRDYYEALKKIAASSATFALPGHGAPIASPQTASAALLQHRLDREAQIRQLLTTRPHTLNEIVTALYADRNLGSALRFAKRTTQAHLTHLIDNGYVGRRCLAPDFKMVYYHL